MFNAFLSLSPEFQRKATAAYSLSYREVGLDVIYQKPDAVDMVQESAFVMSDQIEAGLDSLVIVRAALENPDLRSALYPYIREMAQNGPLRGMTETPQINLDDFDLYPSKRSDGSFLKDTEEFLTAALDRLKAFPTSLRFDFRDIASRQGRIVPSREDNYQHHSWAGDVPWKKLKCTTRFFDHWIESIEAPLNMAVVNVTPPISDVEKLKEIKEQVDQRFRNLSSGERVVVLN